MMHVIQGLLQYRQSFEDNIETGSITTNDSRNILIKFFAIKQEYFEKIMILYEVGSKAFGIDES
jgi:hypothetical protein